MVSSGRAMCERPCGPHRMTSTTSCRTPATNASYEQRRGVMVGCCLTGNNGADAYLYYRAQSVKIDAVLGIYLPTIMMYRSAKDTCFIQLAYHGEHGGIFQKPLWYGLAGFPRLEPVGTREHWVDEIALLCGDNENTCRCYRLFLSSICRELSSSDSFTHLFQLFSC